ASAEDVLRIWRPEQQAGLLEEPWARDQRVSDLIARAPRSQRHNGRVTRPQFAVSADTVQNDMICADSLSRAPEFAMPGTSLVGQNRLHGLDSTIFGWGFILIKRRSTLSCGITGAPNTATLPAAVHL
ncbi:hypothetical protein BaRGS_00027724, partial [Batillaria attramentaria]